MTAKAHHDVVITGMGLVTPLGCQVDTVWQAILAGQSGVRLLDPIPEEAMRVQIAAQVQGFDVDAHFSGRDQKKLDPFIQYGVVAARQAVEQAGLLSFDDTAKERVGVSVGSGIGGLSYIQDNYDIVMKSGSRRISPYFIPSTIINTLSGVISIEGGFKGPNLATVTACTTGTHNIIMGAQMIASGQVDAMVVGGAEKASVILGMGGFAAMKALSTRNDDPTRASRPWDKDRDGFVLGDGAGVVVLESRQSAERRGATILAEVSGWGMSGDAHHMTQPDLTGSGARRSMQQALDTAGVQKESIDYINAHGTSTHFNDLVESTAIHDLFGAHASKLAVSSTKSEIGHLLGAAGAVEAIFCVKALQDQIAPPTINCDEPNVDHVLNFVPHEPQKMAMRYALSNSFGFGGTNGTLLFKHTDA